MIKIAYDLEKDKLSDNNLIKALLLLNSNLLIAERVHD